MEIAVENAVETQKKSIRIGIDVGGTHTKAVAIDNDTHDIIGKSSVKTTHDHKDGVAHGVVTSFKNVLAENGISADAVAFVAHSTTQATNALIEGDVAKVGIVGIGNGGVETFLVGMQTKVKSIEVAPGKKIDTVAVHLNQKKLEKNPQLLADAISQLKAKGVQVVVASKAFGVDDITYEQKIFDEAVKQGLKATMASEITKLYGLVRRTKTAVINACILPKMIHTADSTEDSVHSAGVGVPLMIMRGDGGVMEVNEMRKRPVLSMLSGPAASVMGSLMYLRASNGIYFEVGGTTTNLGVIKNGRPAIDYSQVGKHKTYISSLDVKILGCAGGSMIRANKSGIVDVGPRSAHIAGLDYAVYTDTNKVQGCQVEFFSPKKGDPADYVAVKMPDGSRLAITNSCAANALGLVEKGHFSYGNPESAKLAIKALADYCSTTVENIATQIMEKSFAKVNQVITFLIEKYKLDRSQVSLVGVGGGASSLIIYFAKKTGLSYSIPHNAEVISSIGVALASVRDVVERVIPSPSKADLAAIRQEVKNKAILSGATADTIEVHIDIDPQTFKVTAIATGSTEVKTSSKMSDLDEAGARELAAKDLKAAPNEINLVDKTSNFFVYSKSTPLGEVFRVVDTKGFIRVQASNGRVVRTGASGYLGAVKKLWEEMAQYKAEVIVRPEYYICSGPRLMDFSSTNFDQLSLLMDSQLQDIDGGQEVLVIGVNSGL